MGTEARWKLIFILILVAFAGFIILPWEDKPLFQKDQLFEDTGIQLGLDLQGGLEFFVVLEGDFNEAELKQETRNAITILQKRINRFGLREPEVAEIGTGKIQIKIPGVDPRERERIRNIINKQGRLEFKLVAPSSTRDKYQDEVNPKILKEAKLQWLVDREGNRFLVKTPVLLDGGDISRAGLAPQMGGFWVSLKFTPAGQKKFTRVTENNVGEQLAIVMDDIIQSNPEIKEKITGDAVIRGTFTYEEAKDLADVLNSGNLRSTPTIEAESFIGPKLGEDAIRRGKTACLVALALVLVFMAFYYRAIGLLADIALLFNLILIGGTLALFGATLTLPGIAGIVLTIGMAVDANIIIFERIREEREAEKPPAQAFQAGFEKGYLAVLDANITTLIVGIILYYVGTDAIRGFAVTLCVGVVGTLFTALFCTRTFIQTLLGGGLLSDFSMARFLRKPNIPFLKWGKQTMTASVLLLVGAIVLVTYLGSDLLGIDFTGGSRLVCRFVEELNIEEVRSRIRDIPSQEDPSIPRYPDAQVTTFYEEEGRVGATGSSRQFEIKTKHGKVAALKKDLMKIFQGSLEQRPIIFMKQYEVRFGTPVSKEQLETALEGQVAKPVLEPLGVEQAGKYDSMLIFVEGGPDTGVDLTEKLREVLENVEEVKADEVWKLKGSDYNGGKRILLNFRPDRHLSTTELEEKLVAALDMVGEPIPPLAFPIELGEGTEEDRDKKHERLWFQLPSTAVTEDLLERLKKGLGEELLRGPFPSKEVSIGATVAQTMLQRGVLALGASWLAIIIYLGFRFEWRYGFAAVIALIHDVIIVFGLVALCHWLMPRSWGISLELGLVAVAAFMTIVGYSVNDSIVVFDRIRENSREKKREPLESIVNLSINQVLSRTVTTSITTLLTVGTLFAVTARSASGIETFAFPLLIGIFVGTYSSIFIASPFLVLWPKIAGRAEKKR